ncbi:MAG: hypothetical protein K6F47_10370 [Bacteroidaceae bacterium]|nr:hypothetical protein [Bacteroidaceae bacterium]
MIYRITNDGHKHAHLVKNREELMALRNSKENLDNLAKARQGDATAKVHLLQLAYNLGHVDGALAGCRSIGSFFFHDVDLYSPIQNSEFENQDSNSSSSPLGEGRGEADLKEWILSKKEEIGLMMLERSASGGYHLVCRRVPGTTILENQVRVASILKIEMDTSTKDLQRVVFSTSGAPEDLIYLDDELFTEPMTPEECVQEHNRLKVRIMREQEDVPPKAKKANKHYKPWLESEELRVKSEESKSPDNSKLTTEDNAQCSTPKGSRAESENEVAMFNVQSIDERVRFITKGVMKEKGLEEQDFLNEGGRHTTVKIFLTGATQLLKKEETNGVLKELMPEHWSDENIQRLVNDFYQNYTNPNQRLLKYQEQLFTQSQRMADGRCMKEDVIEPQTPPEMPKKLPNLINLLVSRTPDIYKAAVAHAVFPALATHLWRTRFRYIDNKLHEATLMNCLMAGTGAGKDCISEPIDHIMTDIRKNDAENMKREKEWKDEINAKGANKDKRKRPEGLVIQEIDADMTNPAFVMRMAEADEHFLYVKLNEIDQFDALKGNGSGGQQFRIMCLAFDPGNRYGQTRIGTQSVTERVCIRFNWNATTTIQKGQKYFSRVLTDGPLSRINFCTIPEREIGSEIPVYGEYDSSFDEELRPYIERLCAARGEIDCPQAFKLAKKLNEECAEFSRLSQSRTYENFTFRANVIAYLKACVLFVANDYKWDKTCEDFIRWSLNYDLWCKMQFFGDAIEQVNNAATRQGTRGPRNLLELLPDKFTIEDAKRVRRQLGMGTEQTGKMVSQWKTRGYILQLTVDSFQKAKN